MAAQIADWNELDFLAGGGDMGARLRTHDWSESPLGAPSQWPQSLRSALSICLNSSFPTAIYWGPELLLLYNDAWAPIPAERHPWALGRPAQEVWQDIWPVVGPQFTQVLTTGQGFSVFDQLLPMVRQGVVTETYWNYSFTPIRGEGGEIAGVFNQGHETTQRILDERRRAADAARQRRMFEQAPGFVAIVRGPDHVFDFVNVAFSRLFDGRPREGLTVREVFPELQNQGYFEWLEQVYRSGRRFVAEHQPLRLETAGEPVRTLYLDFIYEPLTDEAGQVIGIFCLGQDVTEAHLARAALEASERRFRTALEIETVGALCFDAEGRLIDANDAFLRMSGHDHGDLATGRIAWPAPMLQCVDDQSPPEERNYRRRDGSTGWALVAAKRLPDGSAFEFLVDISDRKQAEAELREETRTLEALKRIDTELASQLDLAHLVQTVTDAGVELTGADFGAYFNQRHEGDGERLQRFTLSGVERDLFEQFGESGATALFVTTLGSAGVVRSDDLANDPRLGHALAPPGSSGGRLPVRSYLAVPVVARSGAVLGGLGFGHPEPGRFNARHERLMVALAARAAIAIEQAQLFQAVRTANETLEQRVIERTAELTQAQQALHQAQKMEAIGQLTGGIAHDFNNLLAGIIGSLELIERRLQQHRTDQLDRLLGGAQAYAARAASLTQRLLAFSRRQTLEPKPTDVNELMLAMEELIRRSVGPAIEVQAEPAEPLWPTVIDAVQLESALLNLAINARDAMPQGGQLRLSTANLPEDAPERPEDLPAGDYVRVKVSDTGTGIAPEILERIFDPFFTTKPPGQGTGLGLSMVHGFVHQSGGQIQVDTTPGVGTCISLYLPRAPEGDTRES
ncbi:ATP-binding protein [Pseudomonas oryzihabitans]|uniref:ATP-binding protein n=1 Tax=Pseudomonas oryzihabitans TaxID=47885 RepID=UPI0007363A17|nr:MULTISPECIES: ATP-binding protein [Pseudomonas]KTT57453.1 histidine kinase [Pseudomonas psychrotolerans]HCV75490.1 PAS domain-containing protein [Pseudomonas sp.]